MQQSNFKCDMSISATWSVDWHTQWDIMLKVHFRVLQCLQLKLPKRIELNMNSIRRWRIDLP